MINTVDILYRFLNESGTDVYINTSGEEYTIVWYIQASDNLVVLSDMIARTECFGKKMPAQSLLHCAGICHYITCSPAAFPASGREY